MSKKTPSAPLENEDRRDFLTATTCAVGAAGAACAAVPFISSMNPADNVKAQASIEVDLTEVPEGETRTVLWRGKPVFISHRTKDQIKAIRAEDDSAELLDPAKDAERVQKEKWLVAMAVCTHLGCVPMEGGEFGGWRCPCHGSQFDGSGRLRRGPAATNLEIPPYKFLDNNTIKIG